ncbi:MAG: coenzyme F420-0:L-glutamate ligase [Pseudomonadota bacterium]
MTETVHIAALTGIPDIKPGDDLPRIIGDCLEQQDGLAQHDILCIAHKIVSKSENNVIDLSKVHPSERARELASQLNKNPAKVEVVLGQSSRVVRAFKRPEQNEGTLICEHRLGFISANAGVDESNAEHADTVITLPDDPDASARRLGNALEQRFGVEIGVVITDTFGRPWRLGQVNVAIGLHRVPARTSDVGGTDAWGRPLAVTEPALSDELAAASGLVVAKAAKTPVVRMRGVAWTGQATTSARNILRTSKEDVFR